MASCTNCGTEFAVCVCPNCGHSPALTRRKANQALVRYSYAILAGLLGMLIADLYFPLLDRDRFLLTGLAVFFTPLIFHIVSSVRKRLPVDLVRLQRTYLAAGAVSVLLALLVTCNGAFDKSPAIPVNTSIVRKQVVRGRYGLTYTLKVRSWRPGRSTEELNVNARTYRSTSLEKGIVVEVHRGGFGVPWYSGVHPE